MALCERRHAGVQRKADAPTLLVYCDGSRGAALHAKGWRAYVDAHEAEAGWVEDAGEFVRRLRDDGPRDAVILHRWTEAEPAWARAVRDHLRRCPETTVTWVLCQELEGDAPIYLDTMRAVATWTCYQTLLDGSYLDVDVEREFSDPYVLSELAWPKVRRRPDHRRPAPGERRTPVGYTRAGAEAELTEQVEREYGHLIDRRAQCEELERGRCGAECLMDTLKAYVVALAGAHESYDRGLELSARAAR
jgi:hypothetical protein